MAVLAGTILDAQEDPLDMYRAFFKADILPLQGAELSDAQSGIQREQDADVKRFTILQQDIFQLCLFFHGKDADARRFTRGQKR